MRISSAGQISHARRRSSRVKVRPHSSSSCSSFVATKVSVVSSFGILPTSAFTLIEVMIAMMIFAVVALAVLQLMAVSLGAARALQLPEADPGMVAAELSLSNSLVEETVSADFDLFPNYSWERDVYEVSSNGLYQADITVVHKLPRRGVTESKMSVLMYRAPMGPPKPGSGRRGGGR
jgi:prepilin-type N-terminal cleavage/methylation domain-containing protein